MANITSTDVTFGSASCNRVVPTQEDSHSTAKADKQINESRYTQPPRSAEDSCIFRACSFLLNFLHYQRQYFCYSKDAAAIFIFREIFINYVNFAFHL